MNAKHLRYAALAAVLLVPCVLAQPRTGTDAETIARRNSIEKELQSVAIVERKVMVPMSDGKRMAADIYRPKDTSKKYPVVFSRTPYNFNFWDVRLGAPRDMSAPLDAVKRGYAYVVMNERGHFFSEGHVGHPWAAVVGWLGCDDLDGFATVVERQGGDHRVFVDGGMAVWGGGAWEPRLHDHDPAGIWRGHRARRRVLQQGNWYRGGAVQMLFVAWLYGEQNQVRPMLPANTSQEDLIRISKSLDLGQQQPPVDWSKALTHLPVMDIMKSVDGPHGIFADRMEVATGGAMIQRAPNDAAWYRGGLWHDDKPINIPGFWFMSWYDVSVGPNLAAYNHVRKTARPEIADQQYAVIAPTLHCSHTRATADTVVGERHLGDARQDYNALTWGWFDHYLKGEENGMPAKMPKVKYYTMGMNKWQSSETWPPEGARKETFYLASGGRANSSMGDGTLGAAAPAQDAADSFTYDPMNPVPSYGGNVCCTGNAVTGGAFDQRKMEARADILVYSSEPLKEGTEVSGSIDVTLYVSSDAKDTDFTAKLIDVYPDGTAYNLDETIQRVRYREGYEKPPVWMESGKVYKVTLPPMTTSNYFDAGHRIRVEISSSNFPRFDRNLNTGGNNYDETKGVVAHNAVHHSAQYPSSVTLTVVKR